jgi:Holliday junction resolvasome RuvABC endonuclease subunit
MGNEPFKVAMEGLSFSSNGNSLVDIAMATALLRERIIKGIGVENFHVFSPTSIKKFAVKGNAKKDELYTALVNLKEEGTNMNELTQILEKNQSEWITPKKVVNKPVDDVVDATWILLFLKNNLE